MALTRTDFPTKKLVLPLDLPGITSGDWVEMYTVYTVGHRRRVNALATVEGEYNEMAFRSGLLSVVLHRWSDEDVPITPEAIDSMHVNVQDWIVVQFWSQLAGMDEEEKKDSTTEPMSASSTEAASQPSSGI